MSHIPEWKHLKVTRADGVTEVTQHSDGGPLVWTAATGIELTEFLKWVAADEETKVVILTATGSEYCVKLDAAGFKGVNYRQIWSLEQQLLVGMIELNKIVIAAVNGAVRIHSDVPMLADIVLACPEAEFSDAYHFTRNVVPGDGAYLVWSRILGPSRANYFFLTGQRIGAEEAKRLGAVHEIHPHDTLLSRAHELAKGLVEKPAAVLTYTKAALRVTDRRNFREDLSHSLSLQGLGMYALGYHRPE